MARAGTIAVLLPGAFYFLRETRHPPVELLRRYGVPIAVASDFNPGSSPLLSLRLAMNMSCILFGLTPEEALAGVTRNAARALGLAGERGTIGGAERSSPASLRIWSSGIPLIRSRSSRNWVQSIRPGSFEPPDPGPARQDFQSRSG